MQWQPGTVHSVRLKGEIESHLLEYRFGASRGDRLVDEFSPSHFFRDAFGNEVEYRADQIASVMTLQPRTELVVNLTDVPPSGHVSPIDHPTSPPRTSDSVA